MGVGETGEAPLVLVVDDSPSMRQMLAFVLANEGFRVLEAADGGEAMTLLLTNRVDAVVTDQNMPRVDGIALILDLRQRPATRTVPVIVLTTEASQEMRLRGREAGADAWMVKPFDPARLVSVLRDLMALQARAEAG